MNPFFAVAAALIFCVCLSGDEIRKRQEFFLKLQKDGAAAKQHLRDKDPEIRRYAWYRIFKEMAVPDFDVIRQGAADEDEMIRKNTVLFLSELAKKDQKARELLSRIAAESKSSEIRRLALQASWPFHREIKLLRDDPSWDYEVKTIKSIPLDNVPWLFCTDPEGNGHLKGFFREDKVLSSWKQIKMGVWEKQGYPGYDGTAWYKIKFTMPPRMDCNAVEIAFDGVDESAWVWLNGIYLGAHDMGPAGWNKPFAVDCRKEIRWGGENTLVVRVYDAAFSGGIYKPLRVDILK